MLLSEADIESINKPDLTDLHGEDRIGAIYESLINYICDAAHIIGKKNLIKFIQQYVNVDLFNAFYDYVRDKDGNVDEKKFDKIFKEISRNGDDFELEAAWYFTIEALYNMPTPKLREVKYAIAKKFKSQIANHKPYTMADFDEEIL